MNTDKGWLETYYAQSGSAGLNGRGLISGYPPGWYPITSGAPYYLALGDSSLSSAGTGWSQLTVPLSENIIRNDGFDGPAWGLLRVPIPGIYKATAIITVNGGSSGTTRGVRIIAVNSSGAQISDIRPFEQYLRPSGWVNNNSRFNPSLAIPFPSDAMHVRVDYYSDSSGVGQINKLELAYVGAPLV